MNNPLDDRAERSAVDDQSAPLATFFQPFYNLRTNKLQGVEALARRFNASDGNAELPSSFFSAARASGTMRDIDLWILDDALGHLARWREQDGHRELVLSLNMSWDLIAHPHFVRDVVNAVTRRGVPGDRLFLDITTDIFRRLIGQDSVRGRLRELQDAEVSFCLDGFTAKDLDILMAAAATPVDIIKLHPRKLSTPSGIAAVPDIARAVHELELPLVAAGVETPQQLALARECEFEWAQGFLLGEPVEAARALDCPAFLDRP
ncbi:EAL domain-containing protein [Gephyromycinifex aptenodytis]|uniref:EAL domain-containing protein n=1 Tax=Gephyromycinifex aptenodytis TaxID=2716227 RepID=UPI0014470221|nr:EAL domain-containing protein [Gephyromycinifex aptenodytis]